jgi:hypothetical protein
MDAVMLAEVKSVAPGKVSIRKRAGLTIAAISLAPIIGFAILWSALLLSLGAMWLAHALFGI